MQTSNKLLRIKSYINSRYHSNEILLIMFNNIIDSYPDKTWIMIEDMYFDNLPYPNVDEIIIYTVMAYKLGSKFMSLPKDFQENLIESLIGYRVSPYKLVRYADEFMADENKDEEKEEVSNQKLFGDNVNFYNIYDTLTNLIEMTGYKKNASILEIIPLFNTIRDDNIKKRIKLDFTYVGNSNKNAEDKIDDAITIANHYQDFLPLNIEKEPI